MPNKSKKRKVGILGVKVSSKNRMFWSCKEGDEWSSDSEDDDYIPDCIDDDDYNDLKTKKTSKNNNIKRKKENNNAKQSASAIKKPVIVDWYRLPPEIWSRILHYYALSAGHMNLERMRCVCSIWNKIINSKTLWKNVNLAKGSMLIKPNDQKLLASKIAPLLRYTNSLILYKTITAVLAEEMFNFTNNLKRLSLNGCSKLTSSTLLTLSKCENIQRNLEEIDFSYTFRDFLKPKEVRVFTETFFPTIKTIDFSGNYFMKKTVKVIFTVMSTIGRQMVHFKFEDCKIDEVGFYPYNAIRNGCIALTYLNLNSSQLVPKNNDNIQDIDNNCTEKQQLKEFHCRFYIPCEEAIFNCVGDSESLEVLNLSKVNIRSFAFLLKFKTKTLKHLYLSDVSNSASLSHWDDNSFEAMELFMRWGTTILDLDLSKNLFTQRFWESILCCLESDGPLKTLNLNSSNITTDVIIALLMKFPNLTYLNLLACRSIDNRQYRREFKNKEEINLIRKQLHNLQKQKKIAYF